MSKLEWNKNFDLGVRQVDKQHRKLIELINNVHDAFATNKDSASIQSLLASLTEYTHKHFAEEERLMQSAGYTDFKRHQILHQKIREQLQKYTEAFKTKHHAIGPELLTFLQTWLAAHVQGVDQKIAPFLPK